MSSVASSARLIACNNELVLDPILDQPTASQLCGTPAEDVCEYAGRVCYESLGKPGRTSAEYHQHLLDVGHTSVYEHVNFSFDVHIDDEVPTYDHDLLIALLAMAQRPGCWINGTGTSDGKLGFTVTLNPRVLLDWHMHGMDPYRRTPAALILNNDLCRLVLLEMPQLMHAPAMWCIEAPDLDMVRHRLGLSVKLVRPSHSALDPHQRFVSFLITCGRGCSHEMVRHRLQTAFSQHSTRYCDESDSAWAMHPAMAQLLNEDEEFAQDVKAYIDDAQGMYLETDRRLEQRGVPLKQRRGASRWALGTALSTRLVMTASVAAWRHFVKLRDSDGADAEIQVIAQQVSESLAALAALDVLPFIAEDE